MRPSIRPTDTLAALERLRVGLAPLPGLQAIDVLWLRSGLEAYLAGEVATIDAALGLNRNTRRQLLTLRRHELIKRIGAALGLGPTWACASRVVGVMAGTVECPPAVLHECQALRADPKAPRSVEAVWRVIASGAADVTDASFETLRQWPADR